ncbi:hypothetical protein FORC36_4647 (plasmid) [Vibrio vulnificus]|uniref:hypothetical protein n=1 Tax=Vibrio vulnificus TaxID=672 RepID=UPI000A207038|nr:hypothetical protein [Vibrio vulnificus]ARN69164.1 hypothetical protein FORC36_4647 [Vibrio vulnificus]
MSDHKLVLSDDPKKALKEIASYLRSVNTSPDRVVTETYDCECGEPQRCDCEKESEIVGYWQTPEYLEGLMEMADECERISSPASEESK